MLGALLFALLASLEQTCCVFSLKLLCPKSAALARQPECARPAAPPTQASARVCARDAQRCGSRTAWSQRRWRPRSVWRWAAPRGRRPAGAAAWRCMRRAMRAGRQARPRRVLPCACALSHLPRSCGRLWSRAGPLRAARAGGQLCAAAGLRIGRLVRGGRYFCSSGCRCVLVIPDLLRPWAMRARACCKVSSWAAGARCSACGVVRRGSRHDDCVFHCPHVIRSSLGCAAAGTRARCGWPSRERWSSARDVLLRCYAQGYAARWGMRWLSALAPPACGPSAWLPTGRRASLRAVLQELACLPACCAAGACTQERVRLEELAHLSVPGWRSLRASVCGLQGLARFSVANLPCTRLD